MRAAALGLAAFAIDAVRRRIHILIEPLIKRIEVFLNLVTCKK